VRPNRFDDWPCPIARSADLVGDPWIPLILRECVYGITRFDDFQRRLGIGRNVLTARLQRMVELGLIEKRRYEERPPRYTYTLTPKGRGATNILAAMLRFADEWVFEEGREPVVLRDRETGHLIRPLVVDEETGERLDPARVVPAPGPGFPEGELRERWFGGIADSVDPAKPRTDE